MTRNGYPEHLRSLVEGYLAELRFSSRRPADQLAEAMRYSLLAGGKRIRPVLTLAVAEGVADWVTHRQPDGLGPVRHTVFKRIDDVAYGTGLWQGAIEARDLEALKPRLKSDTLKPRLRS